MNRVLFVVLLLVLFLNGAVEYVEARTISIMDSLNHAAGDTTTAQKMIVSIKMDSFNLAEGDTISAQTMIDSIKTAGKEDTLFFNGLVIDGDFNFKESGIETVWCTLSFDTVKFQGDTNFDGVQFKRNVYFKGAQFQSNACFIRTQFQGNANLSDATFKGVANFIGAEFEGDANFIGAQFQSDAHFERALFEGDTDFFRAQFEGDINFIRVRFNLIKINWAQLKGHVKYDRTNYFTFLRNFNQLGYIDDYDECYYDFRVQKRINEPKWYKPLEYIFLDLTCGYGVHPFWAIVWAFIFMLLYALLFYMWRGAIELRVERQKCKGVKENGESCKNNRVHGTEFCAQHQNQLKLLRRLWNAFFFSVGTFTNVKYGDWHPVGWRRYAAMVEGLVGWLIMTLFLVTFVKVLIR